MGVPLPSHLGFHTPQSVTTQPLELISPCILHWAASRLSFLPVLLFPLMILYRRFQACQSFLHLYHLSLLIFLPSSYSPMSPVLSPVMFLASHPHFPVTLQTTAPLTMNLRKWLCCLAGRWLFCQEALLPPSCPFCPRVLRTGFLQSG